MKHKGTLVRLLFLSALMLTSCGDISELPSEISSGEESISSGKESSSEPISEDSTEEETQDNLGTFGLTPSTINFYYYRDDGNYDDYRLWWWIEGVKDGVLPEWSGRDDDFAILNVDFSGYPTVMEIGVILRPATSWSGQSPDFLINFKDYPTKADGSMDIYLLTSESMAVESYLLRKDALGDKILNAEMTSFKTLDVEATATPRYWSLFVNDELVETLPGASSEHTFTFEEAIDLTDVYEVRASFADAPDKVRLKKAKANPLFDTEEFIQNYTYAGDDLGYTYTKEATTFKLWAPTASKVDLYIYKSSSTSKETGNILHDTMGRDIYPMEYDTQGVYKATVPGDQDLQYYAFGVTNINGTQTVQDPYAQSAGVNGHRSQVIDWDNEAYEPTDFDALSFADIDGPNDLVVYEMHVQDLTLDDTWTGSEINRGKYLGLVEEGTTYSENGISVTTGFDHIKELGVNAVQLMPFYDQANQENFVKKDFPDQENKYYNPQYNWGYNPYNFNVLEGGYSSDPFYGEVRIKEFKEVVKAYADAGIRIIMDVVYNHVASFANSPFQKIVPDYYFRFDDEGKLKAESGVGNDTASERIMFEKYIVDSVSFWAEEYQIKGFRFDLMSLITPATLAKVEAALFEIDEDIVVWGEPWSGGGYAGPGFVYDGMLGASNVAAFNDVGRNAIKGDNNLNGDGNQYGWLQKEPAHNKASYNLLNNVKGMLAGKMHSYYADGNYTDPLKTVNYAGCHDNFSLYDQLYNTIAEEEYASAATVVANSLILTAQGTPFFQGGDEILRSKPFDPTTEAGKSFVETHANEMYFNEGNGVYYSGNSYNLEGFVNSYKWDQKIDNLEIFNLYVTLINLRLTNPAFKLSSANEVADNFGYWENVDDLSFSAIAAWNTTLASADSDQGAIYQFYTGRLFGGDTAGTTKNTVQNISWGEGDVKVLFDSTNKYEIGAIISDNVDLSSYQVLIVERIS